MPLHQLQSNSGAPCTWRVATRASASSSARRAKPSAAAATVERNTSSTDMAILKPAPRRADQGAFRDATVAETETSQRMRRDCFQTLNNLQPGVSAGTTKADSPLAPGASPVRAKTV